jgi:hypothetical protein
MKNILIPNTWVATACGSRGKPQKAKEGPKGQDRKPALHLGTLDLPVLWWLAQ